ncbi:serine hydrolase domain-containing protein [Rugosimonospora africana]|uniref:Beta-lactamase-related domain-containing protein n=1 Tax=Rugosimonospora africana TaxID=556532 RepID=A0A8J3VTU1_9ACTN|nr:serine hydrolase domain-containing protein [Rugosimonospora africana]GIH18535.1 hypothetical protein Raf01_67070 [Rugosimonospora africana]
MSEQFRALPDRPSLRYLKIEAKRRLADGEFTSLHDAQLSIAREHGRTSWASLKAAIEAAENRPSRALTHVRWVTERFREAGDPAWTAPDANELSEHFDDRYLALVPADTLVRTLRSVATRLRDDLIVSRATEVAVRARIADLRIEAATAADSPHLLTMLRVYPSGARVTDQRVKDQRLTDQRLTDKRTAAATQLSGDAPDRAVRVAEESFSDLGLVGLVLAGADGVGGDRDGADRDGGDRDGGTATPWTVVRGWADLDRNEALRPDHRFPVYGVTKLITSTAVLRLVAGGDVELDGPANEYLRAVRLADDVVTVRELLTHTGGVSGPAGQYADEVPDPLALLGATVPCDNRRGCLVPGNVGYAVLGQLIADITGVPYPEAATRLVLEPLGMSGSGFPASWPRAAAVTGHSLTEDGVFVRAPGQVCTMPAAGGLWSTAADLVRFGLTWASLLPGELAREALRPQVAQPSGASVGLGWLVNGTKNRYGHPGAGPGAAASLIVLPETGAATAACTNRLVPVEPVNARLARPAA